MLSKAATKILVWSLLIVSCSDSERRINDQLLTSINDTLKQDISISGEILMVERNWVRTLGLNSLENGTSNPEIRIWEDSAVFFGRLFIINYLNASWKAELIRYRYLSTASSIPDSLAGERVKLTEPKSGWTRFLNKLLDLEILTLPDYKILPDYFMATDENFVKVEIGKLNYYRCYEYPDPYWRRNYREARQMIQILEFIKKEFSIK
jgi:hypothetical protein